MKHQRRPQPPAAAVLALAAAMALPAPLLAQQAAKPAAQSPALKSSARVTLNFVNAEIEAVSRAMAAMIERQIVVDPRVKGSITVYSENPLTVREAYLNYLAALRGLGFTVVENAGLLKVVPEADAKLQAGTVVVGEGQYRGDQILTQIFRLNHENPNNLVAVLRPLISPNNTINANPGTNSLVITDYADNLTRIGKIIAALDQPNASEIDVVPLKHAVAADMAPLVQRLADASGSPVPGVPTQGGGVSVLADSRSNALIVRAANPARQAQVRAIIDKLDRPGPGGGATGNIWVVHLKNADAVRLATVVRAAFAAIGTGSAGSGATGGVATAQPTQPFAAQAAAGTGATSAAATAPVSGAAQPSTGGFIQADPATNSLVITAPEPLYRQVRAMIDQLDTRRAQVYIESMIVEVSGNDAADVGFQWLGILGRDGNRWLQGVQTFGNTGPSIIDINTGLAAGKISIGEGLNVGLLRTLDGITTLTGIARLLQSNTNTNIISTPNLITLDNEEAKIVVGSNVPFITGQFTQTGTAANNPFQTIERKDVGITLRIKPQIGEGGSIRLQIYQESSSVSEKVAPGTSNAGPSTDKRLIESNVVVDDGGIIVLGGLIQDRFNENKSKVPLLGDIPFLGALFRSESRTKERTNLMVFIRPLVLRDAASSDKFSLDRYDLIRSQQIEAQPRPNLLLPINEGPVLAPMREPAASAPKAR